MWQQHIVSFLGSFIAAFYPLGTVRERDDISSQCSPKMGLFPLILIDKKKKAITNAGKLFTDTIGNVVIVYFVFSTTTFTDIQLMVEELNITFRCARFGTLPLHYSSFHCFTYQLSWFYIHYCQPAVNSDTLSPMCAFSPPPSLYNFPLPLSSFFTVSCLSSLISEWINAQFSVQALNAILSVNVCVSLSKESLADCVFILLFESVCSSSVSHWSSSELTAVLPLFGNMADFYAFTLQHLTL